MCMTTTRKQSQLIEKPDTHAYNNIMEPIEYDFVLWLNIDSRKKKS